VVEGMVGEDAVEAVARVGNRLGIHNLATEQMRAVNEILPCLHHHARRLIRQRDRPAGGDTVQVFAPEVARPAAQLQDARLRWEAEPIEEPGEPAVVVGAEPLVQRNPRVEVGRRLVLIGNVVFVCQIWYLGHFSILKFQRTNKTQTKQKKSQHSYAIPMQRREYLSSCEYVLHFPYHEIYQKGLFLTEYIQLLLC
jgi:hypothetical protein